MIEVYSTNVSAATGATIPLTTVSLLKGTSTQLLGTSTIQCNKCGVYEVSVSLNVTPTAAGTATIQLRKDGVLQPQAVASFTGVAATTESTSFTTLVQVPENNNLCCPCSIPTTIDILNVGVPLTVNHIDVTVVRV